MPCSVWPEDDVMAAVLDVRPVLEVPAERLDLVARDGEVTLRVEDVPVDRTTGELTWLTPAAAERRRPVSVVSFQVVRREGGAETIAAEYALSHEPWRGPGSPG